MCARTKRLRCRLEKRARFRIAVGRLANGVAIDPERDVVQEETAVHLRHVDAALHAVGERVERAEDVAAVDADVKGEVVARSRRDADKRQVVSVRDGGDDRERSVSTRDAERIRAAGNLVRGERGEIVAWSEDAHGDAALARVLDEPRAPALPSPDAGLTNSTGRSAGSTRRQRFDSFILNRLCVCVLREATS